MSKVNIEVDTETKKLSVTIDGKEVANVSSVSAYVSGYSGASVSISISEKIGDLDSYTTLYASESEEAKEESKKGVAVESAHAGFVQVKGDSRVNKDVANYFSKV